MARKKVKVWPNGEYAAYQEIKKPLPKAGRGGRYDEDTLQTLRAIKSHGINATLEYQKKLSTIGLSKAHNSDKIFPNRQKYGSTGITSYGRRMVRNGCHVLGELFPEKGRASRISLLTLTIPSGFDDKQLALISENWNYLTEAVQRYIRRKLEAEGLPPHYVAVTEIQEKRSEKEERPILHLHATFVGRHRGKSWVFKVGEMREVWREAIARLLEQKGLSADGAKTWESCSRIERVEKSVEGYLGKYMSKGSASAKKMSGAGYGGWLPAQWWSITAALRREVKQRIRLLKGDVANYVWECNVLGAEDMFLYSHPILIADEQGVVRACSYVGRLRSDVFQALVGKGEDSQLIGSRQG